MKTLILVLSCLVSFFLLACEGEDPCLTCINNEKPLLGSFDGEFYLDPSVPGSVANIQVAVYASEGDFLSRQPLLVTKTNANGRYFIFDVPPGRYILEALKDNDASGSVTPGDYYLAHVSCPGCPTCMIVDGSNGDFGGKIEVVQ